jgi:N-acetylmuramoyl-L-alanine amidase
LFAFAYLQAQNQQQRAAEEQRKDADSLSSVMAAQHKLAVSDFDFQAKLEFIAQQAQEIADAAGVVIALAEGESIVCRARSGLVGPPLGARLNPQSGISGECVRTAEVLHCEDTEHDARVDLSACRELGIRSILAVPLEHQGRIHGLLEIFSGWAGVFGDREIRAAKLLGGQIIEALWAEHLRQRGIQEVAPAPAAPEAAAAAEVAVAEPEPALESVAEIQTDGAVAGFQFLSLEFDTEPGNSRQKIILVAALVVFLLAALAWSYRAFNRRSETDVEAAPAGPAASAQPQPITPPGEPANTAPLPLAPAQLTQVRVWSKPAYTSIALFLDSPVKYQSATLRNPDRVYLDLHQTKIAMDVARNKKELVIPINDGLVGQIRIAPTEAGAARVVLDVKAHAEYNTVLSPNPPYRLMIAIHRPGAHVKPTSGLQLPNEESLTPASELRKAVTSMASAPHIRIVIDPGHGGSEDGAIGPTGLKEKDLVLDVGRRLGDLLHARLGAEIVYTRTEDRDVPLDERTSLANRLGAELFVSVHANSSGDPTARGVETYYMDSAGSPHEKEVAARENAVPVAAVSSLAPAHRLVMQDKIERSRRLANHIQQALYTTLAGDQPLLRNRGVKRAPFVVLLGADMPSVLAEISFLSSPADEHELESAHARDVVADALARGIAQYLWVAPPARGFPHTATRAGK